MRLISKDDVSKLDLKPADLVDALEIAFRASREGKIPARPKSSITLPDASFYITATACWPEKGLGIFHNIMGASASNVPPGQPHYTTRQLVSDYRTAVPLALVDGTLTSNMLPACVTALTARYLARRDSSIATFVGAGVQARANLQTLLGDFPLREIRVLSRTARSANEFAEHAKAIGLTPRICSDPREAIEGAHIIVTSVPGDASNKPFLDPAYVSRGAFVSAVDVGRSWLPGFETFDRVATDDREQAMAQHRDGRMAFGGTFDTEIPELVAGARPGRGSPDEKIVVIHPGNIVGVFGITLRILDALDIHGSRA